MLSSSRQSAAKKNEVVATGVRFSTPPVFPAEKRKSAAKKRGLIYEARVVAWLLEELAGDGWVCFDKQWISYYGAGARRQYAQPDFFALDVQRGNLLIVEVKLTHTAAAWVQLNYLYEPLLRQLFPPFDVVKVEIAAGNNGNIRVPEEMPCVSSLEKAEVGRTSFMMVPYAGR